MCTLCVKRLVCWSNVYRPGAYVKELVPTWNRLFAYVHRDHFVYAPSHWETMLHCNIVSYWLGAYTKCSLCAYLFGFDLIYWSYYQLLERFWNPTITDTITFNEQPHVTSSLSVFVNVKPVEICFGKCVRLVQFMGELLEFKLSWINQYKLWRLKCTHKYDEEAQISEVVGGNIP